MKQSLRLVLALGLSGLGLYGCSSTPEAAEPSVIVRTADDQIPTDPQVPGGGPTCDGECLPTTSATQTTIRSRVAREARVQGWNFPVITFGLTCCTYTYFSVDYVDSTGTQTYINGIYNAGDGSYTFYP